MEVLALNMADPVLHNTVTAVLSPHQADAVSYGVACLCGHMRVEHNNATRILLDGIAKTVPGVQLTEREDEIQAFAPHLIMQLSTLAEAHAGSVLADELDKASQIIKAGLESNDRDSLLTGINAAWYAVYESWDMVAEDNATYMAISDMSVLWAGADDSDAARVALANAIYRYYIALHET